MERVANSGAGPGYAGSQDPFPEVELIARVIVTRVHDSHSRDVQLGCIEGVQRDYRVDKFVDHRVSGRGLQ